MLICFSGRCLKRTRRGTDSIKLVTHFSPQRTLTKCCSGSTSNLVVACVSGQKWIPLDGFFRQGMITSMVPSKEECSLSMSPVCPEIHAFLACFLLYVPSCVSQERSWRWQRTWSNVRGRLDSSRKTTQIFAAFWKKEVFFSCTLPTSLCHFKWPCAPWSQRGPSTVLSSSLGHIRWGLPSRFLFRSTRA